MYAFIRNLDHWYVLFLDVPTLKIRILITNYPETILSTARTLPGHQRKETLLVTIPKLA